MSKTTYSQSPGPLGKLFQSLGSSHAAKIPLGGGFLVVTSGQPGFDLETGELVRSSLRDECEACFNCVEEALRSAGVEDGLAAVHKFTVFLIDVRQEETLLEVWRARMPHHRPAWVTVGINSLAVSGMRVEIQAEAMIY